MLGVGFATIFAGYWLLAYGFSQVRGCNAGFFEIVWPGSYGGCKGDQSTNSSPFIAQTSKTVSVPNLGKGATTKLPLSGNQRLQGTSPNPETVA